MNWTLFCWLAQSTPQTEAIEKYQTKRLGSGISNEVWIILGATLAVGLALFAWALFIRKRRSQDPHRRIIEAGVVADDGSPAKEQEEHHHGRHHRHRRRRRHHYTHRNPTLQETGGLPPLRAEDEAPSI